MMAASMRWFARLALLVHACLALRTPSTIARKGPCTLRTPSTIARNAPCTKTSRRQLLLGVSALVAPSAALALDPSFPRVDEGARKPNILLNKPLEWIRIADQLEADETLGELADPKQKDAPAVRLAKVVRLDDSLRGLAPLLDSRDGSARAASRKFRSRPPRARGKSPRRVGGRRRERRSRTPPSRRRTSSAPSTPTATTSTTSAATPTARTSTCSAARRRRTSRRSSTSTATTRSTTSRSSSPRSTTS